MLQTRNQSLRNVHRERWRKVCVANIAREIHQFRRIKWLIDDHQLLAMQLFMSY